MSEHVDLVVIVEKAAVTQSTVDIYAAHWHRIIAELPEQPETEEEFILAREFEKSAPREERRIREALNSILQGSPEIAEIVQKLQELESSLKTSRIKCSKSVSAETEKRKNYVLNACFANVSKRTDELFVGPLATVQHKNCLSVLTTAGKGKRTIGTFDDAVNAAAETIILERIELAELCNVNLELIDAADLPAVSAVKESLMQRPTSEVQTVIAQRKAEAELAEAKKKAAAQREPEKLAELKLQVAEIKSLPHMTNWKNRHQNDLSHPEDQAELWQFFGRLYEQIESKFKPPHPAYTQQPVRVVSELKPEVPEVKPIQQPSPHAREIIGRPPQMPQTGFAFEMSFHCGPLDEAGTKQLYSQICDLVEVAGGTVISVKKI